MGGDHDCDRSEEHLIETNLSCPKCNAFVLVLWGNGEKEDDARAAMRGGLFPGLDADNADHDLPGRGVVHVFAVSSLEQAGLVSVMTGALTGAYGLFLGKKE